MFARTCRADSSVLRTALRCTVLLAALLAGALLPPPPAACARSRFQPPDLAGTRWRIDGQGKVAVKAVENGRARRLRDQGGAHPVVFFCSFDAAGTFSIEDTDGIRHAAGFWQQRKARVRLDLVVVDPPSPDDTILGDTPIPADAGDGDVEARKVKIKAKLKRSRDGETILQWRLKYKVDLVGGSALYALSGSDKGVGLMLTGDSGPPPVRQRGTAVLDWDPPAESADGSALDDLAGFRVYAGVCHDPDRCTLIDDQGPPAMFDVGLATHHEVGGLEPGFVYFFYVTAYDTAGNESDPSAFVFKEIPAP